MHQPSMFTRIAAVEAEVQSVKDVLDQMLDILADVKANQDEMRRGPNEPGWAAPDPRDSPLPRPRRWVFPRLGALRRIGPGRSLRARLLANREEPAADPDDHAYWKVMARSAIAGLFLLTVFMVGLYQLLRQG